MSMACRQLNFASILTNWFPNRFSNKPNEKANCIREIANFSLKFVHAVGRSILLGFV